ncbi:MAG: hypothetical protein WC520_01740 [Candidatus Paceibacterota bacterium]
MKKHILFALICITLVGVLVCASGCTNTPIAKVGSPDSQSTISEMVIDCGNDVYYFHSGSGLGFDPVELSGAIADFRGAHPELEYVSEIVFAGSTGQTYGVTVIFRKT